MIANHVSTFDEIDPLFKESNAHRNAPEGQPPAHILKASTIPIISVTTTLSAGEYNYAGGATNDVTKHKQLFIDPIRSGPKVIVLDPELSLTTPERVWLSTGLRAVDHCVETICSSNHKPEGTAYSLDGIKLLIPALLQTKNDPKDRDARLRAQLGGAQSMKAHLLEGVRVGKYTSTYEWEFQSHRA
jgi:alcohol dehydrogenase class IV